MTLKDKMPISVDGMRELESIIQHLIDVERPAAIREVSLSREYGDLSENADYESANTKLSILEVKLSELRHIVDSSRVVDVYSVLDDGVVRFGSVVKLLDLQSNSEMTIILTSQFESNMEKKMFSIQSPFGSSLLGSVAGDIVVINAPSGQKEYKVLSVSVQKR